MLSIVLLPWLWYCTHLQTPTMWWPYSQTTSNFLSLFAKYFEFPIMSSSKNTFLHIMRNSRHHFPTLHPNLTSSFKSTSAIYWSSAFAQEPIPLYLNGYPSYLIASVYLSDNEHWTSWKSLQVLNPYSFWVYPIILN